MLRAVLDANVLASGFMRPQGPPGDILRRLMQDRAFDLVTSPAILAELRRCLFYPRVRSRIRVTDEEIEAWVVGLGLVADVVEGSRDIRVVRADPDDDKYLAVALEGRAGFVVSGDAHLLEIREYAGVLIVTPRQFLGLLPESNP